MRSLSGGDQLRPRPRGTDHAYPRGLGKRDAATNGGRAPAPAGTSPFLSGRGVLSSSTWPRGSGARARTENGAGDVIARDA